MTLHTVYDAQRYHDDKLYQGVVDYYKEECDIASIVPVKTIGTMKVTTPIDDALPGVTWRARHEEYTGGRTGLRYVQDEVFALGAQIDLDKVDVRDKMTGKEYMRREIKKHVKSMAFEMNDIFINGDHASNENTFEGLKVRVANMAASQTIYASTSSTTSLDINPISGTPTADELHQLLWAIESAQMAVDGNHADWAFTDISVIRSIKAALRKLNIEVKEVQHIHTTTGERASGNMPIKHYFEWNGTKFVPMGLKRDKSTRVVATEDLGDGANSTPIYFCRLGEDYVSFIQEYPLEVVGPWELDNKLRFRIMVDHPVGMKVAHPESIAVLRGVAA